MYKNILVPIDVWENNLTDLVTSHVENIAKIEDSYIHFITIIPTFSYPGIDANLSKFDAKQLLLESIEIELNQVIKRFIVPNDRVQYHISIGSVKDEILKLAEKICADLIIIGSRRPSVTTHLLGSTAASIVRYAKSPVLVIR